MRMENHLYIKGWAPTLVLIQSPRGTRRWPTVDNSKTSQNSLLTLTHAILYKTNGLKIFFFQISLKVTVSWFSSSFFKYQSRVFIFVVYVWRISLLFNKIVVIWNKRNHLWKPELGVKQIRLPNIRSNVINAHKKELWKTVRLTSFQKTQSYSVSIRPHHVYP